MIRPDRIYCAVAQCHVDGNEEDPIFKDMLHGYNSGSRSLDIFVGENNSGVDADQLPNGESEFGLDVDNPISVKGVIGAGVYLDCLETIDGKELLWERIRTCYSSVSDKPIDAYQLFDLDKIRYRQFIYLVTISVFQIKLLKDLDLKNNIF